MAPELMRHKLICSGDVSVSVGPVPVATALPSTSSVIAPVSRTRVATMVCHSPSLYVEELLSVFDHVSPSTPNITLPDPIVIPKSNPPGDTSASSKPQPLFQCRTYPHDSVVLNSTTSEKSRRGTVEMAWKLDPEHVMLEGNPSTSFGRRGGSGGEGGGGEGGGKGGGEGGGHGGGEGGGGEGGGEGGGGEGG